jgi:hypothetical protein
MVRIKGDKNVLVAVNHEIRWQKDFGTFMDKRKVFLLSFFVFTNFGEEVHVRGG